MKLRHIRALVEGRVQGVWFRRSTQQQAQPLGITGHAKNLPDGRVEVLASGDSEAVAALIRWLHQGPANAQVVRVTVEETGPIDHTDFTTC